ncbi:MAG: Na+/H+ antiporter subunit E [Desulfurococcaceae archaeon]
MIKYIITGAMIFTLYVLFSGSLSLYTLITGLLVSFGLSLVSAKYLIVNEKKLTEVDRFLALIYYFFKYMTIIEIKAHIDVVKRIISMDIKPGIVKIPVKSKTRYARLLIMGSITNTPGTIVVDERDGYFYVNWINTLTDEPEEAWRLISSEFEKYAIKVFE